MALLRILRGGVLYHEIVKSLTPEMQNVRKNTKNMDETSLSAAVHSVNGCTPLMLAKQGKSTR